MNVCKCVVPLRHSGTLNSSRAVSPLVWLVEEIERWEVPDDSQVSFLKIGVETSQIVLSPVSWGLPQTEKPVKGSMRQTSLGTSGQDVQHSTLTT
ncbi:hypothetical protein TNCV_1992431 [Trichonephila clavipes]|nr:hypothetical protein TNCV_1992431 [Trichonephila clavipes]